MCPSLKIKRVTPFTPLFLRKRKASKLAITSQETKAIPQNRKKLPLKKDKSAGQIACLEVKTESPIGVGLTVLEAVKFEPNLIVDVDMVGDGGTKVDAVDISGTRIKTVGGLSIHDDKYKQEVCVASVVSSNGNSGNLGTNTCSTTYDGKSENGEVPFACCCLFTSKVGATKLNWLMSLERSFLGK